VLSQTRLPKPGVKGLDKRVIRRRPGPAESPLYAMAMRPGIQRLGRALRTMIDKERLRPSMGRGQPLQHGHHPLATSGSIDLDRWTLTTPVIHSRERAKPPPVGQAIADAVETPVRIWSLSPGPGHAPMTGTRAPALQAEREPCQPVQPIDPLVIPLPAFPLAQHLEAAIPITDPGGGHIPQPPPQGRLIPRPTAAAIARAMHRNHLARSPLTDLKADPHKLHQLPALSGRSNVF
jgi:hypothetical protein